MNIKKTFLNGDSNEELTYYPNIIILKICIMYNGKSRHICHRYNIVKHLLLNEIICIDNVKSKENTRDPLTKVFSRELV